jgi:hypothetical protein
VEHIQCDDMDVVEAITLPWSVVTVMAAKAGLFAKA